MTLPGLPEPHIAKLDCGTCRKCCKNGQLVILTETDDPDFYQWRELYPGVSVLKHAPNGDCIYLGPAGCTIWGKHPKMCRIFDCAAFVRRMDEGAFPVLGKNLNNAVIREGRKRLASEGKR